MSAINQQIPTHPEQILDSLASNIIEFRYDPDSNVTFEAWYTRYDGLFSKDAARLNDEAKVRLLLRKLGPSEHDRYVSYILPKHPKDINFENTVSKLKSLFGTPESVISKRYRCLQVTKQPTEDYKAYACRLNKLCVEFELGKLTEDQFKCLMFVCGLKSEEDAEIRTRLLIRMEENRQVSLEQISDECQRLLCIKHDTAMNEGQPPAVIKSIRRKQSSVKQPAIQEECTTESSTEENEKAPFTPCWNCGSMHYSANCTHKNHKCKECGQLGHKEGYCMSAKKARKKFKKRKSFEIKSVFTDNLQNRRRFVQVEMNGKSTSLQLDTGSDFSVISEKTWKRIGEPASTPAYVKAFSASGKPLKIVSQFISDVTINNVTHRARVFVAKQQLHLLGLDFVDLFDLGGVPLTEFCSNKPPDA